ncbi:MAG: hypothetical protein R3234_06335 [Thermoanaerobaculia bacterium]|nr:hypothetical protein [Thermoanaerobaculia bacterium]
MSLLTREDLQSLHEAAEPPCVSIFLPTHRAGAETQQNPIRFKNLLKAAEEQLRDQGFEERVESLLEPARRLLEDFDFWQHQSDGLAVFLTPDSRELFRIPRSFEELAVVGDRFHFGPLLPLLTGDGRFHILALSQKRVRLLEATRDSVREMDLHDIPESLQDVVGYDWEERSLQFHTGTGGPGGGRRRAMFHGQSAAEDDVKEEIAKFLHVVDTGVRRLLPDDREPLVLAGVDYLRAIYRQGSHYPKLMDEGIDGNPDAVTAEELREKAWPIVEPQFRRDQEQAAETFHQLAGSDRASNDLEEVVTAGHDGRVATLFLDVGQHAWGSWDPETRELTMADSPNNGDEDLLDRAALDTLFHGGDVFAVEVEEVPGGGSIAAVFRY